MGFCPTRRRRPYALPDAEKLFAVGDDFWIGTEDDRHAFKDNAKALRIRSTFILESPHGEELLKDPGEEAISDTMEMSTTGTRWRRSRRP